MLNIEVLLVQFLVLAFTGAVWWLARRDLRSRPAPPLSAAPQADTRELEQLCATLEALVTDLAGRLEAVERQMADSQRVLPALEVPVSSEKTAPGLGDGERAVSPVAERLPFDSSLALLVPGLNAPAHPPLPVPSPEAAAAEPGSGSHAPLYALLDEGVTDPAEIARRTGLGRGEVDLILSLRARRAL